MIDHLDRKLLRLLQEDGRISNVDLAERVGLSPTATSERVKRLTREGIIAGYGARLDPVKLGRGSSSSSRCCSTAPRPTSSTPSPGR